LNKNINRYIIKLIEEAIQKHITDKKFALQEIPPIILTTPKNPEHGHLTTNIALQLSGIIKSNPRKIADRIVQEIEENKEQVITKIVIAGPGFINFYLKNTVLHSVLREIMLQKNQFGKSDIGKNEKINVEFVSVNPTGPLHVGHGKCAAVGDVLAKILKAAGYQVKTEYYINDHGKQIDTLAASVLARYRSFFYEQVEFPENGYQGEYIISLAKEIKSRYGDKYINGNDKENIEFFKEYAQKSILQDIKDDLNSFGVRFDNWFSEGSLYDKNKVQPVIEKLVKEKHVYQNEGALWFRASDFGDEKDRVVIRENGEPTYFASDIAYHDDKYKRGFQTLIDIWGADHHGYIKRMKAAIKAMGYNPDSFQVLLVQFVTLIKDGKVIGMSTRGGKFITLKNLLQEVGSDVARYFFLMHSHDSHTEFDLNVAKSQSMENPVFYIQYAYARICSIIEKGRINNIILDDEIEKEIDLSLLDKNEELELIKKLASFKRTIENSAVNWKPHLIANYLHELAAQFHKYYTEYKVLDQDRRLTEARLYLVFCVKTVLENALSLLGIKAPEKM
jgi:arginyl-tRNA synthetase